jgi:hypothetical protein
MPSELEDLVEFLHSPNVKIRTVALDYLVGLSTGPEAAIFSHDSYRPIKDLKILARDKGKTIVQQSLTILGNLCGDIEIRDLIAKDDSFVKFLISSILDLENRNADLACIVLTNLGKSDDIERIHDWTIEVKNKEIFKSERVTDLLLDAFVKGFDRKLNQMANFDYLAYFFADYSRFSPIRKYFVTRQSYDSVIPISKLLPFTEYYESKTRREGIASTIKNSLFELQAHEVLVDTAEDVNILPYLLLPIISSKDGEIDEEELFNLPDELQLLSPDKTRDPVPQIILTHLESLVLLSSTRTIREILRKKSVYPLIRELHKNVSDEDIEEVCDRLVQVLMRDEEYEPQEKVEEIKEDEEESDDDDAIMEVV